MLKKLLVSLVKEVVSKPKEVRVEETAEEDGTTHLSLSVSSEDMGLVIGKQGRTISALRSLVKTAAAKAGKRVFVELLEKSEGKDQI